MRGFRGVLVNFALLSPPAIATTSLGKSKHCRGRCQDPLRRIATAGGSVEFLEWLLFQKFVLAVVKSFPLPPFKVLPFRCVILKYPCLHVTPQHMFNNIIVIPSQNTENQKEIRMNKVIKSNADIASL
jgi:hypothetical protein